MSKAIPYHKLDCISLLEALETFDGLFRQSFGISTLAGKTLSSMSKLYYLSSYYPKRKLTDDG